MEELHNFAVALTVVAAGLWLALVSTRLTARLRVPAPAVFLIAAAAISDVFPGLAEPVSIRDVERIGVVALIAILFDGGLSIGWRRAQPSLRPVVLLGLVGTFVTAALGAVAAHVILPVSWTTAAIIGSALAPTDPAVMFSVLARRDIGGRVPTILEGEAGANDPVSIALVVGLISYATSSSFGPGDVGDFLVEMAVGAAVGIGGAMVIVRTTRTSPLPREGLIPVRTLALAGLIYGGATLLHGSGFLAVFVAGVWVGDARMPFKGEIERFHSALASLGEIVVFAAIGLTIHLYDIGWSTFGYGVALAAALVLVVRPLAVYPLLAVERLRRGERAFIALTGFKGAVPILLAALVVLEKVPDAALVYRLVFVVVAVSVVAQGLALEPIARVLGVPMTIRRQRGWALRIPLRHEPEGVVRLAVVRGAIADGRRIRDLPIGEAAWVALVVRSGRTEQPRGSLVLEPGDEVVLLADPGDQTALRHVFTRARGERTA
jgi:potassium/hydrogen antiporter